VINAGIPGYTSKPSLQNLRQRVLPLQPDIVIYYEANNELTTDSRDVARQHGLISADENHISSTVETLAHYSLLFKLVHMNARIAFTRADGGAGKLNGVPHDLPRHFIEQLDQMHQELRAREIAFVLSTFVVKYRRDQDRATQVKNADVALYY